MIRETSREAYQALLADGTITGRKLLVIEILYRFGPLNQEQIHEKAQELGHRIPQQRSISNMCRPLERLGLVEISGDTLSKSGKRTLLWKYTGRDPVTATSNGSTRKVRKQEALSRLSGIMPHANLFTSAALEELKTLIEKI